MAACSNMMKAGCRRTFSGLGSPWRFSGFLCKSCVNRLERLGEVRDQTFCDWRTPRNPAGYLVIVMGAMLLWRWLV